MRRFGVSRAQAFEDFLLMSVCALSGGRMEDPYLATVKKHSEGEQGKRGCDSIGRMFGELVAGMEQDVHDEMKDLLGDLFQGAITYGEAGQFLTPMPICDMMSRMTIEDPETFRTDDERENEIPPEASASTGEPPNHSIDSRRKTVFDPCSGSGGMLLAAAKINRHWEFVEQDIDLRCVRMTALNLAFRNLYGYVIWGNSLGDEKKLVYRTGFDGRGFIREVPVESCPAPIRQVSNGDSGSVASTPTANSNLQLPGKAKQLELF